MNTIRHQKLSIRITGKKDSQGEGEPGGYLLR